MPQLVLASSSPYRAELLGKLQIPFLQASPDIDESPLANEQATALVKRLAEKKAKALALQFPKHLIIGSDQVACFEQRIIGKPGNIANAKAQLRSFSGQSVEFLTGLCVFNSLTQNCQVELSRFKVHFRSLSEVQIENYIEKEQPLNCAGSFKSEGLGIALFTQLEGDDPNSLIGLPLIKLVDLLNQEGLSPL